ncbi:MAG: helix-turn-helix transcriptional regulator [Pseudomonadota bacterium]
MDEQLTPLSPDTLPALDRFSPRQIECLTLVHEGLTSKEIALRLGVSPSTVDNHVSAAMALLDTESRRLAAKAMADIQAVHPYGPQHFVPSNNSNDNAAKNSKGGDNHTRSLRRLPPIGGSYNGLPRQARAFHIVQIAALIITSILAITLTIAGLVHLFSQ